MANMLDRAYAYFWPDKAAKRAVARKTLSAINSGYGNYGANLTKRSMRGWHYHGGSPEEDIEDNLDVLRQRSRDAYMGIPIAAAMIKTMRTNVVCSGLVPTPQVDADFLGLDEKQADRLCGSSTCGRTVRIAMPTVSTISGSCKCWPILAI